MIRIIELDEQLATLLPTNPPEWLSPSDLRDLSARGTKIVQRWLTTHATKVKSDNENDDKYSLWICSPEGERLVLFVVRLSEAVATAYLDAERNLCINATFGRLL